MDVESIKKVYALSVAAALEPAFILENTALSEAEIVSRFRSAWPSIRHPSSASGKTRF